MSIEINQIKNLVSRFFEKLGCDIEFDNECLVVKKVPQNFEKYFGKKSPYYFTFDHSVQKENSELITKGSYLLKLINDYLEDKAETTLYKIDLNFDAKKEIPKIYPLRNCKILSINKKDENSYFVRFIFLTTLQYLNEKEQIKTEIYVKDGKIFDFQINDFKLIEGKKRDVSLDEKINSDYNIAKEELKNKIDKKISNVSDYLNETLNKEINRVKEHFQQQLSEIDFKLIQDKQKISDLKKEFDSTGDEYLKIKIDKLEKKCDEIENSEEREKIKKEQEFFIQDEIQKHGLNVKNKLVNTSIIYYPIFLINFYLKSKNSVRIMELKHDAFKNKTSKIYCNSCNEELNEIILCSSGHLTCRNCGYRCNSCDEVICKKCQLNICSECGKKVCDKCISKCSVCQKKKCKSHLNKNKICNNCLKKCFYCGEEFAPEFIVLDPQTGRDTCRRCKAKDVKREVLKSLD